MVWTCMLLELFELDLLLGKGKIVWTGGSRPLYARERPDILGIATGDYPCRRDGSFRISPGRPDVVRLCIHTRRRESLCEMFCESATRSKHNSFNPIFSASYSLAHPASISSHRPLSLSFRESCFPLLPTMPSYMPLCPLRILSARPRAWCVQPAFPSLESASTRTPQVGTPHHSCLFQLCGSQCCPPIMTEGRQSSCSCPLQTRMQQKFQMKGSVLQVAAVVPESYVCYVS